MLVKIEKHYAIAKMSNNDTSSRNLENVFHAQRNSKLSPNIKVPINKNLKTPAQSSGIKVLINKLFY